MAGGAFRGGIHPPDRKESTAGSPIVRAPLAERLIVPMSQHLGAPCLPLVAKGDRVERGQVIGDVDAMISSPVHAPAAGEVVAIGAWLTPSGSRSTCVTIATDPDRDRDEFVAIRPADQGTAAVARAAGIVGLGGAAFPAAVKLVPAKSTPVDTVILNGCECEPFLTCDHRVMLERPEAVIAGAKVIAAAVGATRVVVAVEDNKPDAIDALRAVAEGVEVISVTTRYPQGAEKQLIFAVTGRVVPGGKLPAATGCLVHNVQTAAALADAVASGKPLMERVVTVSGAVARPGNFLVAIGTPVSALIALAGGLRDDAVRVIAGGPMTAQPLGDLDVPVVKGTSGIVALTAAEAAPIVDTDQPCIRCGRCVDACPMILHPYAIANYADRRMWDGCERYYALDCIECGCCSFVCPTSRPLLQLIRTGKGALLAKGVRR